MTKEKVKSKVILSKEDYDNLQKELRHYKRIIKNDYIVEGFLRTEYFKKDAWLVEIKKVFDEKLKKKNQELDNIETEVKVLRAYKRFVKIWDITTLFLLVIWFWIFTFFYL